MDRAWRSRRCQLHRSKVLPDHEISVERPAQTRVEGLGAIDVGYGYCHDLELQIDGPGVRNLCREFIDGLCAAHCDLRSCDVECSDSRRSLPRRHFRRQLAETLPKYAVEGWERMDDVGERRQRRGQLDREHELAQDFAGTRRDQSRAHEHATLA